jgi:hypothetical protein
MESRMTRFPQNENERFFLATLASLRPMTP